MARYDRGYDFGLRGYRETNASRGPGPRERRGRDRNEPITQRITARYNRDYVFGGRGESYPRYPRNYNPFGGDREERVGDWGRYRQPYMTTGGTRTWRGSFRPAGYDNEYLGYDRDF